jgi:hypothetical protein
MNHKNTTLVVAAIVAAAALTGVAFAIPQQVMAGGYRHHNNNHNGNSIRVNQAVNQLNACNTTSTSPPDNVPSKDMQAGGGDQGGSGSGTVCLNIGSNSADIHGNNHR